jgi:hypothetical protein
VLTRTGDVWCAGYNGSGQIRRWEGQPGGDNVKRFVLVPELSPASQIGIGPGITCAKLTSGATRCRGDGAPKPADAAYFFQCGSLPAELDHWSQVCVRSP